jgi:hypothetical protein
MADISFADILDMPVEEIKEPKALPPGTYLCVVDGQPEYAKVGQNQTDCVNFMLKPLQAQADVDQKQLAEVLNGAALSDKKIRYRLFITNESKHRLKKFLADDLGIEQTNFRQMVPEAMGKQVMAKLTHQASQDGTTVYTQVQSTAKV